MTPKIRQTIYYIGAAVPSILGLALIWGGIDQGAADSIGDIIAGFLNLIGAAAPATPAIKVGQQRKDGTLDNLSPAEQVAKSVQDVIEKQVQANADLQAVKQAVTGAVGTIPGIGPLAGQLINMVLPNAPQHNFANFNTANTQPDLWRGARF